MRSEDRNVPHSESPLSCWIAQKLPTECPNCQRRFLWGWLDEELSEPLTADSGIRMLCIRRPDQTLFCPECEERVMN